MLEVTHNTELIYLCYLLSHVVVIIQTGFICIVSKTLYKILFPGEYLTGFIVAPYLFLCPLLLMLFQVAASQFTVIKKTWYNTIVLFFGAVVYSLYRPIVEGNTDQVCAYLGY